MNQPPLCFDGDGPSKTRADQIEASFVKFHTDNHRVWLLFERKANDAWSRGRRYSARTIISVVRFEIDFALSNAEEGVKINDHYSPYYARLYLVKYPERKGLFEMRVLKSSEQRAHGSDKQVFLSRGVDDVEDAIAARLRGLL